MFTFQEDNEYYGVDWDGPVPNNDEDLNIHPDGIEVPVTYVPINEETILC